MPIKLNPFKESNLNDLQRNLIEFIKEQSQNFAAISKFYWKKFLKKGKERITVMFIPHSEKRIINFHISIFAIGITSGIFIIITAITSIAIIRHSSTVKEVSKLKQYGIDSKKQIKYYKEEINRLYNIFQKFKPEITHLYSFTPGGDIDSLWAKGGVSAKSSNSAEETPNAPMIETLNLMEIDTELKEMKKALSKIKEFLEYRKKIIENTPSIWPVNGYIVSRFGTRNSPDTLAEEFHNGIDIEAFPGSEIKSTSPGKVESIAWDPILGLSLTIRHKYGFKTIYSHCQRITVEQDQKVSKGEVVGYVGRTGRTTRYICYYQIRIGSEFVDPIPYLNKIYK
jgi:murein DD-endopeptidase MepM/ murein hydrolase activator NlpD